MEDILTTIRELCIADCIEIIPTITEIVNSNNNSSTNPSPPERLDLPSVLLEAYNSHPKTSPGKTPDRTIWRSSVIIVFKDIFSLVRIGTTTDTSNKINYSNQISEHFSDLFIGVVSTDLLKLYQAMGTIADLKGREPKIWIYLYKYMCIRFHTCKCKFKHMYVYTCV